MKFDFTDILQEEEFKEKSRTNMAFYLISKMLSSEEVDENDIMRMFRNLSDIIFDQNVEILKYKFKEAGLLEKLLANEKDF